MGFQERQRAKKLQRILEASQEFLAKGQYPAAAAVSRSIGMYPQGVRRYQRQLIAAGSLVIPEGLPYPPMTGDYRRPSYSMSDAPKPVRSKPADPKKQRLQELYRQYQAQKHADTTARRRAEQQLPPREELRQFAQAHQAPQAWYDEEFEPEFDDSQFEIQRRRWDGE